MDKATFLKNFLPQGYQQQSQDSASAFAPVNIALVKYWGKRNSQLNLPQNASLSIGLRSLGTTTHIHRAEQDEIFLNGQALAEDSPFAMRLWSFVNLLRPTTMGLSIHTHNDVPTAAGLASSASGFAALVKAMNGLMGWQLSPQQLSIVARMGSGSACRSLWDGFVRWNKGERDDGLDSYAEPLAVSMPQLRLGLVELSQDAKAIGSTLGMQQTLETCPLYAQWPAAAEKDLVQMQLALAEGDFSRMGELAEANALMMHATMIATRPSVFYWLAESVETMHRVWQLRAQGIEVYFTMDAGPNVKLIFLDQQLAAVLRVFPQMQVVEPFA